MLFALGFLLLIVGPAMFWTTKIEDLLFSIVGAVLSFVGLFLVIIDVNQSTEEGLHNTAFVACGSAPTKGAATCEAKVVVSLKDGRPTGITFAPFAKTDAP